MEFRYVLGPQLFEGDQLFVEFRTTQRGVGAVVA
ncbi:Uncharacterised protein [Mycobacteroides abscessus subsp. massiliense]|nr:Uncharacterised protein [Mycobacteroides abscessus subsp. massiliense]